MGVQDFQRMQAMLAQNAQGLNQNAQSLAQLQSHGAPSPSAPPPQAQQPPAIPNLGGVQEYMNQKPGPTPLQVATGFGASMVPPGPPPPALTGNLDEIVRLVLGDPKIKKMYGVP